jgi:hypothetical protein
MKFVFGVGHASEFSEQSPQLIGSLLCIDYIILGILIGKNSCLIIIIIIIILILLILFVIDIGTFLKIL